MGPNTRGRSVARQLERSIGLARVTPNPNTETRIFEEREIEMIDSVSERYQAQFDYSLQKLLPEAVPLDVRYVYLPRAVPQDVLPLLDGPCREYYQNLESLPLEEVRAERAYMSVVDGHYEPFIRSPSSVEYSISGRKKSSCASSATSSMKYLPF